MHRSDPDALLRHLMDTPQNGVYVLLDVGPHLDDPVRLRVIAEVCNAKSREVARKQADQIARNRFGRHWLFPAPITSASL